MKTNIPMQEELKNEKVNKAKPLVSGSLLCEEEMREPIENALYATKRFLTTQATELADGIINYLKDAGFTIIRNDRQPTNKHHTLKTNTMSNHVLNINTILHTKDGSKIGNAIVTGREGYYWEITTDYGNKVKFTSEEIDEHFNIAWSNCSKENEGYDCQEMQEMMSSDHKHRVFL